MQEFAADLIDEFQPDDADKDRAHTLSRVRAVLRVARPRLGNTLEEVLEAVVMSWERLVPLVQQATHAQNGNAVMARRVVFLTMVVLFELDESLHVET